MIIRGGQAMILPTCLATPAELDAGVLDIEGLVKHVANAYLRRRPGAYLTDDQDAELLSYLMLAAWTETARYAPRDGGSSLVGYLTARLQFRCTDWFRSYFGRGKTPRPTFESLDQLRDSEFEADCA